MCGIIAGVAQRDIAPILLEGLKRLAYRGYDSAGIATLSDHQIQRQRTQGKVSELENKLKTHPLSGTTGIAHTRWATHGKPNEQNAHPHLSHNAIALVHNGIIENHADLRKSLEKSGYQFQSDTDTEIIAHLIHFCAAENKQQSFLENIQTALKQLKGAFALGIIHKDYPEQLIAVRKGSPLVIGLGIGENFIASDQLALLPVTQKFIYLEEGDLAQITRDEILIFDQNNQVISRPVHKASQNFNTTEKGKYRHFMQKEIFEQAEVILNTLDGRIYDTTILDTIFGSQAQKIFDQVKHIQLVACGTSYYAGLVAKHWFEEFAGIPCQIEVASEFRYRNTIVQPDTLFVTISQSGETADTLAALKKAKDLNYLTTLCICNVPESTLARDSDLVFITRAGREVGVASTKSFTTQLIALLMLTITIGKRHNLSKKLEKEIVEHLKNLPDLIKQTIALCSSR